MAIDRDQLLAHARVLPEHDVETPAGTVRVRALSRAEVLSLAPLAGDAQEIEVRVVAWGLIDPALSVDEVRDWQKATTGEAITAISDAVAKLSGMGPDAQSEAEARFRAG